MGLTCIHVHVCISLTHTDSLSLALTHMCEYICICAQGGLKGDLTCVQCTCIHACIDVHVYAHAYANKGDLTCVHVHVYMHVSMCICMYMYMHMYMQTGHTKLLAICGLSRPCIPFSLPSWAYLSIQLTLGRLNGGSDMHICTYIHDVHICIHVSMRICMYMYMHMYVHPRWTQWWILRSDIMANPHNLTHIYLHVSYTRMCRFVSFVCAHKVDSMANLKKTLVETCEIFSCASAWGWKSDGSLWY